MKFNVGKVNCNLSIQAFSTLAEWILLAAFKGLIALTFLVNDE